MTNFRYICKYRSPDNEKLFVFPADRLRTARTVCMQLIKDEKAAWGGTLEIEGQRGVKSYQVYTEGDHNGTIMLKPV